MLKSMNRYVFLLLCLALMYWGSPKRKTDPLGALVVTAASGLLLVALLLLYDFAIRPLWKKVMGNKIVNPSLAKREPQSHSPFLLAAADGNVEEVTQHLASGVDIDQRGPVGDTALMLAARNNKIDCIKLLLARGADVSIRTPKKSSAEDVARRFGHGEVVEILAAAARSKR